MSEYWDKLARSIDDSSGAALGFKGEYDALMTELTVAQSDLEAAFASNAALRSQVTSLQAGAMKLAEANALLTTQVRQLRATVATYKARIAELEALLIPGKRCELPVATITALRGRWQKPGNPNIGVLNEVWNTAEAGPQVMKVCDETSWYVESTQPATGSVKSYPCTQVLFPKTPLSSLKTLSLRYAHEVEPKGLWNAAVDAWVGGLGNASTAEVMVWPDYIYPASLPPSGALKTAEPVFNGVTYIAWTRKNSNGGDYIALVAKGKANMRSSGTLDLKAIFNWLTSVGWLKATDTLAAVNYGIEISSTDAVKRIFRLNDFDLKWTV